MNLFKYLNPSVPPRAMANRGEMDILRERIFHTLMLLASVLGIIGLAAVGPIYLNQGFRGNVVFFAFTAALFIVLSLLRLLPYGLRAFLFLATLYAVGVYAFFIAGLAGNGRVFMLSLPILAGILLGLNAAIPTLILSFLTMAGFAIGMTQGFIKLPETLIFANSSLVADWIASGFYFILLGAFATISLVGLIRNMQSSLLRRQELVDEIQSERSSMETRINQRTEDLSYRLTQIRSAAEISRSISSVLDIDTLLQDVVDLILERFDLYYVGLFLLDETGKYAILKAGTGEAGKEMLTRHHQLPVAGASMIGWATGNQKSRIALDIGEEAVRFSNPFLPRTRSEMALPILSRGITLGALTVQSDKPNAFDNDDILILEGIADSLAVAIQNANLFTQTQRNLEEIQALNRQYLTQAWTETIGASGEMDYSYVAGSRAESTPAHQVDVPLTIRDQVIGVVTLEIEDEILNDQDKALVESITTQTAQALENARLLEDVSRKAVQEERLNALTADFSRASTVEEIIRSAVMNLGQIPNVAEVSLHLAPPDEAVTPNPIPAPRKNGRNSQQEG